MELAGHKFKKSNITVRALRMFYNDNPLPKKKTNALPKTYGRQQVWSTPEAKSRTAELGEIRWDIRDLKATTQWLLERLELVEADSHRSWLDKLLGR